MNFAASNADRPARSDRVAKACPGACERPGPLASLPATPKNHAGKDASAPGARRRRAGFTLAEVLAALTFMAIVIPVALHGLHVASLAGEVAVRKADAARVADRILSENTITTNLTQATQSGTITEGSREYRWTLRNENWNQDAMQVLSVEVGYVIQGRNYSVRLTTLGSSTR